MSKAQEVLAKMEALVAEIGVTTGIGYHVGSDDYAALSLDQFSVTSAVRAAMLAKLGDPKRPRAQYERDDATWDHDGIRVRVYGWKWDTCSSCGQAIPTETPVS